MNFLDAVRALQAGECGGIRRNDVMWKYTLDGDGNLCMLDKDQSAGSFLADDWELVNPKPQTVTKEVKRWAVVDEKTGGVHFTSGNIEQCEVRLPDYPGPLAIVELTGTYTVEVPKVRKMVTGRVEWALTGGGGYSYPFGIEKPLLNMHALAGKTGVLTFTED